MEERAELAVVRCVDGFLLAWHLAVDRASPPPPSLDFARGLVDDGFHLLTTPGAINYLDECRSTKSLPDRKQLLTILLSFGRPRHSPLPALL